MRVVEIRASRLKALLFLLMSLGFVSIPVLIPSEPGIDSYKMGFVGVFFGACSLVFAVLLVRPQRLVLGPKGFTVDGGLVRARKEVLWRDVEPLFVYRLPAGGKMIGYNLTPDARSDSVLARTSRFLGADGALPKGWPGSPEEMVRRINAYRAEALGLGETTR